MKLQLRVSLGGYIFSSEVELGMVDMSYEEGALMGLWGENVLEFTRVDDGNYAEYDTALVVTTDDGLIFEADLGGVEGLDVLIDVSVTIEGRDGEIELVEEGEEEDTDDSDGDGDDEVEPAADDPDADADNHASDEPATGDTATEE